MPTTFSTLNRKGYTFPIGVVPITVSPQNIVWAEGRNSKLGVALYSIDPVKHDTRISSVWTTNPAVILSPTCGQALNYADDSIN